MTSEIKVTLLRADAKDTHVIEAALVSNTGKTAKDVDHQRFIHRLMEQRHGSPFEHAGMTFHVDAPIFVFREWMRHRISSFNEESGRYSEMRPKFYTPAQDRKMINNGTPMKPSMAPGSKIHRQIKATEDLDTAEMAWAAYQRQLENGISRELARTVLPLNIYSQMIWTVNPRSLMNFLALRVQDFDARVVSYPQREIEIAAQQVEKIFKDLMPITHAEFVAAGRVAP